MKSIPNSSKYSNSVRQMIGSLMNSRNSLKNTPDEPNRAIILGVPIQVSEDDKIKRIENIYELTPEIFKALSQPLNSGKTMKNDEDFLMLYNILKDVNYTGRGDRPSNGKTFFKRELPKKVSDIHNMRFDENTDDSDDLQGEGVKLSSHLT